MVVPQTSPAPLIPQFYAGREILITGATGFMGKVLVERLLFTCPDVSRLHLLMRPKKDLSPEKRLLQLKQSPVFDVVRAQSPQQLDKLRVVPGDTTLPGLGLDHDAKLSLMEVSVIFHGAASLKFHEPLRHAVDHNVRPVLGLLALADTLPRMQAFIHVSTAYSNAERACVEECVYAPPAPLADVLQLVDAAPMDLLAQVTPQYISPKPNTYTFTKALAETAVSEHARSARYPLAIFRPTVVVSALRHPFPGWIENLNGPCGVLVATGKGVLHAFRCEPNFRADLLPVDIAIDTLMAVAWETAVDRRSSVRVYNCSTMRNPTTWRQFELALRDNMRVHPLDNALWYPSGFMISNKYLVSFLETFLHTIPLQLASCVLKTLGIKTKISLGSALEKLRGMSTVLPFFSVHQWSFSTDNVQALDNRLSPADREIYNLDTTTIDWKQHFLDFTKGSRKYLLREKDEDLPEARRHMRKLRFLHYATLWVFCLLFLRLLLHSSYLRSGLTSLLGLCSAAVAFLH